MPRSRLRTASTTWAPRSASTLAVSRPMPPLAPVTTNRRPSWRGTSRQRSVLVRVRFCPRARRTRSDVGRGRRGSPSGPTVQSRSWICWMVRGRISRAASPPSPSGKVTSRVTLSCTRWLPPSSRTLWPSARAWKVSNGARLPAMWSRSAAPQPTRAASSSSTGVKSGSSPGPMETPPPRLLVAFQRCSPIWWRSTLRWVSGPSSAAMGVSLPPTPRTLREGRSRAEANNSAGTPGKAQSDTPGPLKGGRSATCVEGAGPFPRNTTDPEPQGLGVRCWTVTRGEFRPTAVPLGGMRARRWPR